MDANDRCHLLSSVWKTCVPLNASNSVARQESEAQREVAAPGHGEGSGVKEAAERGHTGRWEGTLEGWF